MLVPAALTAILLAGPLPAHDPPSFPLPLRALVTEMRRAAPGRGRASGALNVYSRAFAAYALVDAALDNPAVASEAREDLDGLLDQMLEPRLSEPFGATRIDVAGHSVSGSVAFRGHLALMLEGRALLGALQPGHAAIRDALLHGLAQDVVADAKHLLPSYGKRTWPADNEVLAAALALAVRAKPADAELSQGLAALQGSLATLERKGLPPSAVKPDELVGIDVPRGCALSWTVGMRGLYDPPRARALYSAYRAQFFFQLGPVAGFREWPDGVDRPADADSGPIILGIGTAASGMGIGAARLAGQLDDHRLLLRSSAWAGATDIEKHRNREWTERAMLAWAKGARAWVTTKPRPAAGTQPRRAPPRRRASRPRPEAAP